MSAETMNYQVAFPDWYDDRAEWEHHAKGFLPGVTVLVQGARYSLYFIDPIRLGQDLQDDQANGKPYYTEPGLVVVPEVTPASVHQAVAGLFREGFFRHLRPLEEVD